MSAPSRPEDLGLQSQPLRRQTVEDTVDDRLDCSRPTVVDDRPAVARPRGTPAACPRCGAALKVGADNGWCVKCGYCKVLENARELNEQLRPKAPSGVGGLSDLAEQLRRLPRWVWVLLRGVAVILLFSAVVSFALPAESLLRAIWSTAQLGIGLILLFFAQVRALALLVPEDADLSGKDLVYPVRLWKLAFEKIPLTTREVHHGVWGATLMFSAVVVTGGLLYWTQYYKPAKVKDTGLFAAINKMAKGMKGRDAEVDLTELGEGEGGAGGKGGEGELAVKTNQGGASNRSLTESVNDFAKTQEGAGAAALANQTSECVVTGYEMRNGQVSGLLVAVNRGSAFRHAGIVRDGFDSTASAQLLERLEPLKRPTAPIPSPGVNPTWVEMRVYVEIGHAGYEDGIFKSPVYRKLLRGGKRAGEERTVVKCAVLGYTTSGDQVASLALAVEQNGKLRFAGAVTEGITPEIGQELLSRLAPLRRPTPALDGLTGSGNWVEPEVAVEVTHNGYEDDQRLKEPVFKRLLKGRLASKPLETTRCLIVGYQADKAGGLTGLVVGTVNGNKLRYAGVVRDGLTPEAVKGLVEQLRLLEREGAIFPDLEVEAVWVRPKVACQILHEGTDPAGLLEKSRFKTWVREGPQRAVP